MKKKGCSRCGHSFKVREVCVYCGSETRPPAARVGDYRLPVTAEAARKINERKAGDSPYMLNVCPACGTIIDVIEKKG